MTTKTQNDDKVISFLLMRKLVGVLGMALPFVLCISSMLFFSCEYVQESVSHYYHTGVRNIFLAVIFMIAFFLYSYKGYDNDYYFTRAAAILALGIAFFPTSSGVPSPSVVAESASFLGCTTDPIISASTANIIHLACAAGFLLVLSYVSLILFTKGAENPTPQKRIRDQIYKYCGWVMIASVVLIALYIYLRNNYPQFDYDEAYAPIFFLETLAFLAFGTSWLIKGEALLGDKDLPETHAYTTR